MSIPESSNSHALLNSQYFPPESWYYQRCFERPWAESWWDGQMQYLWYKYQVITSRSKSLGSQLRWKSFRILKKWKLVSILVCEVLQVLWGFMWQSKDNVIVRKKPSAVVLLKHIFSPFVGSNPRIGFQCKISKFHNTIIIPSCVIFQSMFLFLEILKPSLSYSYCKPCSICLYQAWQGGQKKLLSSNWPAAFFSRQEHRKRPQLNFSKLNWIGINSATLIS